MKINYDDGLAFGMGVFETIRVEGGEPIYLDEHLDRMEEGAFTLGIRNPDFNPGDVADRVYDELKESGRQRGAIKIILTDSNLIFIQRDNLYTEKDYRRGFSVNISSVIRNETSPFTYVKSINYGENITEKRRAHDEGFDEPIFVNSKGQLTEGATTNLFIVQNNQIFTPPVGCGLLNGIERQKVIENQDVEEKVLYPEDAFAADAMFLTNSLLGMIKVRQFETRTFE